jgi:hypothetical protein
MTLRHSSRTSEGLMKQLQRVTRLIASSSKRFLAAGFGIALNVAPPAAFGDQSLTINVMLPLTGPAALT